jgi:hypothetical protein
VAGNADLSYSITDEQIKKRRLAQTSQNGEKAQGKETGSGQDGKKVNGKF